MSLESEADSTIVADNIRAVQAIYFAYMLEEMRAFQVIDRLAQLFAQGLLPIKSEPTKQALLAIGFGNDRLTQQDRGSLYARALGVAGGEAGDAQPNRQFLSLWLRFVVAVTAYAEEQGEATVLAPPSAANAGVRDIARALALNASRHGDGLTGQMAARLLAEVHETIDLLGSRDVLHAYGARDAWQVIDLVSRNDLGEARNVARFRTQAIAGSRVLRWLADHIELLREAHAAQLTATPEADALVDATGQVVLVSNVPATEEPAPPDSGSQAQPPRLRPELRRAARDLLDAVGLAVPAAGQRAAAEQSRGPVVMFHGDCSTGKTLAAYQLAHALGMDIFRIDLSQVTSKYIGETEKNLDTIFENAEAMKAVLLLDEADALLGKRTEVKDAHDRYANVDVAYLLQRLEEHVGPVILATNRKENIDEAFLRRLRHVVEFPRRAR